MMRNDGYKQAGTAIWLSVNEAVEYNMLYGVDINKFLQLNLNVNKSYSYFHIRII